MVKGSMTGGSRAAGLLALKNYLASRAGIQNLLRPQINDNENQAVDEVYATIFWFQFNLVLGPSEKLRGDDPG
jgi:hypothetical protein